VKVGTAPEQAWACNWPQGEIRQKIGHSIGIIFLKQDITGALENVNQRKANKISIPRNQQVTVTV
jgi:hypothetical protein